MGFISFCGNIHALVLTNTFTFISGLFALITNYRLWLCCWLFCFEVQIKYFYKSFLCEGNICILLHKFKYFSCASSVWHSHLKSRVEPATFTHIFLPRARLCTSVVLFKPPNLSSGFGVKQRDQLVKHLLLLKTVHLSTQPSFFFLRLHHFPRQSRWTTAAWLSGLWIR